jgi:sulfotransferase family protein
VLVTGTPRSGTTVVGDMLARAKGARYLYEPLNRWVGVKHLDHDFPVPGSSVFGPADLSALLESIRRVDLSLKPGVFPHDTGWRRHGKRLVGSRTTMSYRLCRADPTLRTVVWKDPFALFMAGEVARAGIPVIVTVRNPWAVAASFKRLGWGFDVADVRRRLLEAGRDAPDHPGPPIDGRDPITSAAALWDTAHRLLLDDESFGTRIVFVDLDQVVAHPVDTYEGLYRVAGLPWTDAVAEDIEARYRQDGSQGAGTPTSTKAHDWKARDVSQVNLYWKDLLTEEEAATVTALAGATWERAQESFG